MIDFLLFLIFLKETGIIFEILKDKFKCLNYGQLGLTYMRWKILMECNLGKAMR